MRIEQALAERGLVLPAEPQLPPGMVIPFAWARTHGNRVYVSGHSALTDIGVPAGPFGKVPSEVTLEAAQAGARGTALAILASLQREIGDLDRMTAWLMVQGMVNADPGYDTTTMVINEFSDLILDVFGPEIGRHARTAIGVAALPFNNSVVIAAEVEIS